MRPLLPLTLVLIAMTTSVSAAEPGPAVPVDRDKAPAAADGVSAREAAIGPIHAEDPDLRSRIESLYLDRYDLEQATRERITALAAEAAAEPDGQRRLDLQRQAVDLKRDLQREEMLIGLEIARLNGDVVRVAEYEKALDQLEHPEAYLPAPLDPAIAAERARAHQAE